MTKRISHKVVYGRPAEAIPVAVKAIVGESGGSWLTLVHADTGQPIGLQQVVEVKCMVDDVHRAVVTFVGVELIEGKAG